MEDQSVLNMNNCILCPRECHVDRTAGSYGYCGQTASPSLARAALHIWEEPCISGSTGSGAVFFCGCNLRCIFCQNSDLALSKIGREINISQLPDVFLALQDQGAANINLVTPGHFIPALISAIPSARKRGLTIPIVYNTGSYEKVEALRCLDGLIDVYMPDLKYMSSALSQRLSNAPDYFSVASAAVSEMFRQTGVNAFDSNGMMQKGILLRHLVLPGHIEDSRNILKYVHDTYGDDIYVSIMNQYTPMPRTAGMHDLSHTLSASAYSRLVDYCLELGFTNAYIQEGPTNSDSFIPIWDYTGVPISTPSSQDTSCN